MDERFSFIDVFFIDVLMRSEGLPVEILTTLRPGGGGGGGGGHCLFRSSSLTTHSVSSTVAQAVRGNSVWKQHVETACGNSMWNSMWKR